MKAKLRVTQQKSTTGKPYTLGLTVKGLGLKGPGSSVVVDNTPSFRGAIKKILSLVNVEEVDRG
jgi:large subunit ribosomal protein L30